MPLKRISNELAGVNESENRATINAAIDAVDQLSGDALQLSETGLTKDGVALTAGEKAGLLAGIGAKKFTKIQSSIAKAINRNPQELAPWSKAPTWQIATVYGAGQVVRGTGADSDNLYFLAGSSTATNVEATSAASGTGPSGTALTLISDNTCRWIYMGKGTSFGTLPLYSTVIPSSSSDVMNGYFAFVPGASIAALGMSAYRPSSVTGSMATEAFISGGKFSGRTAGRVNGSNTGTVAAPTYNSSSERGSYKFMTNARTWFGLKSQSTIYKNCNYDILVNGRHLSESPVVVGADNTGFMLLNLAAFGNGPKEIEIRVYDNLQVRIAFEFVVDPFTSVWPSENPNRFKLTFEGDSITFGSYVSGYKSRYWIERIVGDLLGTDDVYNNAVGSTGAINDGGTKTTYIQRLPDVVSESPDIHVIGGFTNDAGSSGLYTSANRVAAILDYLQAVRSALPNCTIVLIGAQLLINSPNTAGAANLYQVELDAKAAFDVFADDNSLFIPLMTAPRPLVYSGAGPYYVAGASPYTDNHPVPAYYPFIGRLIAGKIMSFFA